ncbi:ROK family protein [Allokutzneria sp. A3M-2-11 16]|uniref:ROK family protein n=1 Tax=Allokutzneria sp. A3M-2-11 16 TaxID=2962043 RepID=UPI0020B85F0D|nr:ROK family protein [Allokutzneria sp. A3M-2-11 16]MCP3804511.1 ROK family protein [Allokutzneria sp. A3M-2-11 16]
MQVDVNAANKIPTGPASPGEVLEVLRRGGPMTRQELQARIGLSRATMVERLDALGRLKLLRTVGHQASSGGRRAELLAADETGRCAVVADIGVSHVTVAVADLTATVLASQRERVPNRQEPTAVLRRVLELSRELLAETGRADDVCAMAVGVPGQVDPTSGSNTAPPTMPGWSGTWVHDTLSTQLDVPVLVENDANALAFGEHLADGAPSTTLLGVKVATGIGSGVVLGRRPYRGVTGSAGEIGHIKLAGHEERCGCGRTGCLAAVAGGRALIRRLRPSGARTLLDVVRQVEQGRAEAVELVTEAGKLLGGVLATVVSIINPQQLRLGGPIGALPQFVDAVRSAVLDAAHPVALRGLRGISPARLGDRAALVGLAGLSADAVFAPAAVDALITA